MLFALFVIYAESRSHRSQRIRRVRIPEYDIQIEKEVENSNEICYYEVIIGTGMDNVDIIAAKYNVDKKELIEDNPSLAIPATTRVGMKIRLRTSCALSMNSSAFKDTCLATKGSSFISLCSIFQSFRTPGQCREQFEGALFQGYIDNNCKVLDWSKLVLDTFGAKSFARNNWRTNTNMEIIQGFSVNGGVHYVVNTHCDNYIKFDPLPGTLNDPVKMEPVDQITVEFRESRYTCRP